MPTPTPEPVRLPARIAALVATDRLRRPPLGRLTPAQAEQLVRVIRRTERYDEPVSVPRALVALAAGRPDVALPVLTEILGGSDADRRERLAAAEGLGLIATPEAEQALLAAARDRDPRVQQEVFASLGLFGGPAALRDLVKVQAGDPHAHRQLVLARAIVAHRHGLRDGPFLPETSAGRSRLTARSRTTDLTLRAKTPKTTAGDLERVHGSRYGVRFADRALGLQCGRREWTAFLNAEVGRTFALDRLAERPWIAAVLCWWYPAGIRATTQYLVLSRPSGDGVRLDVVRGDGEVVYVGSATLDGTTTAFTITETDRPGTAPVRLSGRLGPRGVEVDVALAGPRRIDTPGTADVSVR